MQMHDFCEKDEEAEIECKGHIARKNGPDQMYTQLVRFPDEEPVKEGVGRHDYRVSTFICFNYAFQPL